MKLPFRSDINGLRGIAVLAVTLFHFQVYGLQGGFIGVDVFFVISGFLMTAIIFNGINQNTFSLRHYYLNRAQRIVPALAFMCFVLLIYGWFYLLPSDYKMLGKHVISSIGFFSNIIFWQEAGYFDSSAYTKWLLHTWSLSVEWQFYLVYPLLIIVLSNLMSLANLRYCLLVVMLLSLGLSIYITAYWPTIAFYFLPTRAFEMLAGGLIYLFPIKLAPRLAALFEKLGALLILFCILHFSSADAWPGALACLPVLGTVLIIAANQTRSRLTNHFLIQWLGTASYSIYLWHWPIVILLHSTDRLDNPLWKMAGILFAVITGYLSYLFVEKNVLAFGKASHVSKTYWAKLSSALILIAVLATTIYSANGINNHLRMQMTEKQAFIEKYKTLHINLDKPYHLECDFTNRTNEITKKIAQNCANSKDKNSVFLWGDSMAQGLSTGVHAVLSDEKVNQVATSLCAPSIRFSKTTELNTNQYYCDLSNRFALAKIKALRPKTVIAACWKCHATTDWQEMGNYLQTLGVQHFIVMGPSPGWATTELIVKKYWREKTQKNTDIPAQNEPAFLVDHTLQQQLKSVATVEYVSLIDAFCHEKKCMTFLPNSDELISINGTAHFTPTGSTFVVKNLLGKRMAQTVAAK